MISDLNLQIASIALDQNAALVTHNQKHFSRLTVMITIEPTAGVVGEVEWYLLSAQSLESAYGVDEREYTLNNIKKPNPEYQA